MHTQNLKPWQHKHSFSVIQEHGEKRTLQVLLLTAVTMVVEIIAGLAFGSMALLADGWHMGTHVAAFVIPFLPISVPRSIPTVHGAALAQASKCLRAGWENDYRLKVLTDELLTRSPY
jgi:Co/Zn/Cd efflux system component